MSTRPKKLAKLMGAIIGIASIVGTVLFIRHLLESPANGVIYTKSQTDTVAAQVPDFKQLKGSAFSLDYPSSYAPSPMGSKSSYGDVDNFILSYTNVAISEHIAVAVSKTGIGLSDNSSYRYRKSHPELYKETMQMVGVDEAHIFTNTKDGYEQAVFIQHKDLVASIALTSNRVIPEEHARTMQHMLASFHWK